MGTKLNNNTRKIKVHAKRKFCKKRLYFLGSDPKIILQGQWLAKAGFQFGDSVNVYILNNSLVITPC